jgi:hypothetical protein
MRKDWKPVQLFFEKKSCAKELKKSKGITAYE